MNWASHFKAWNSASEYTCLRLRGKSPCTYNEWYLPIIHYNSFESQLALIHSQSYLYFCSYHLTHWQQIHKYYLHFFVTVQQLYKFTKRLKFSIDKDLLLFTVRKSETKKIFGGQQRKLLLEKNSTASGKSVDNTKLMNLTLFPDASFAHLEKDRVESWLQTVIALLC